VNDITLLDSWVISAQGYFTMNSDLFPRKFSKRFNGCHLKALVLDHEWFFTTKYVNLKYSNGTVVTHITGLEMRLLSPILEQMNMTFIRVSSSEKSETEENWLHYFVISLFQKEIYIILGNMGNYFSLNKFISSTNSYYIMTRRWYVPCSVKYPRWSSIFRILSLELWLVLIISIVIVAISTTLVGRYSCTSERQGYKTLKSSFTNLCSVILGCQCHQCHAHRHYVRCSSPGCVSLWLSAQCSKHFSQRFLLTPATKHQLKSWMSCSPQVLNLPTKKVTMNFSRELTGQNHHI